MKRNVTRYILLFFAILVYRPAFSQLATFTSTNPKNLVVCGDAQSFTLKVTNTSLSDSVLKGKVTVKLPTGFHYVSGSVSSSKSVSQSNISIANAPVFSIPDIYPKDSVKFSIKATVDCNVISFINGGGSIRNLLRCAYSNGGGTYLDTGLTSFYNVAIPSLSLSKFTNQSYSGTLGDTFSRQITITNTTNAPLNGFSFYIKKGTGIYIKSLNKTYTTNYDSLLLSFGPTDFKKVGNGDSYFDQGEKIVLVETDSIIACSGLGNSYGVTWGCNGSNCQKYTTTSNVVLSAKLPNLSVSVIGTQSDCYAPSQASLQTVTIYNGGSGPAKSVFIDIMEAAGVGSYYPYFYTKIDPNSVKIAYNGGTAKSVTPDTTFPNYAYSCLGSNPVGRFWIKIPVLTAGTTITITFNMYSCCIDQGYLNGWSYGVTYSDQCGNNSYNTAGYGRYYGLNYQFFGIPVGNTTELIEGDTTNFYLQNNYQYNNLLPGSGGNYLQYQFTFPKGIKFDKTSFYQVDVSGKILWYPDSVKTIGGVTHVTFTGTPPSGFNFNSSRLNMKLIADTSGGAAKCNDKVGVYFKILYTPRKGCSCTSTLVDNFFTITILCVNPDKVGLDNKTMTFMRTSYGLPDNNDDGQPDASGSLDFTKIRRDKAMVGDTITSVFKGRVLTDSAYSSWKYGFADYKFTDDYLGVVDVSFTIKDSTNSKTYKCTSVPYAKVGKGYTFYFGTDTLRSAGCTGIPSGFVFKQGDSVLATIHFVVKKNTQDVHYITLANEYYFSTTSTPISPLDHYSLNKKTTYFYAVGYYFYSYGYNYATANGCSGLSVSQSFYLSIGNCCSNYYGGNIFPYEFRDWATFSKMRMVIPKDYTYTSGTIYYYPTEGTGNWGNYNTALRNPSVSGDTLTFNIDSIYKPNGPFHLPDDGYAGTIYFNLSPTCATVASTYQPIYFYEYFKKSAFLGGGYTSTPDFYPGTDNSSWSYVNYTPPSFTVQAALPTVSAQSDTMSWTVYITNLSNYSSATKAWIALQSNSGKILIDTVFKGNKKITPVHGLFKLDTVPGNTALVLKIKARMKNCVDDSIKVLYGWDCSSYPDSFLLAKCSVQSIYLFAQPTLPSLQISSSGGPDSIFLCDTANYSVTVSNVQTGSASDVKLFINLPPGTAIVKGTSKLKFPVSGSAAAIAEPDSSNPYLYTYDLIKINSYVKLHGFPGNFDTTKSSYNISFRVVTNCNYISGSNLSYIVTAYDVCNNPVSTTGTDEKTLKLVGAKTPYSGSLTVSGTTTISGCGGVSNIKLKFVNNGPVSTDSTDFIYIDFPNGISYKSKTLTKVHNSPTDSSLTITKLGTTTRYTWKIPKGVAKGDSIVYKIAYTSDSSLSCGNFSAALQTVTTLKLTCVSTHQTCAIKVLTGIGKKTFTATKPKISISGFTATAIPAAPGGEIVTVKATITNNGDTLRANSHSVIKYYYDADGDKKYSTGDVLIAHDTINTLLKPNATYSEKKTFFVTAGKACAIIMMWDTVKQNCACTPVQAFVNPVQLHDVNNDTMLCSGITAKLGLDSISGYKYSWSPSTGLNNSKAAKPFLTLSNSGASSVTKTYILNTTRSASCTTSDSVHITVYPAIKVSAGSDKTICAKASVTIGGSPTASGGSGVYTYKWSPAAGLSSTTVANPVANPSVTTTYIVLVTDSKGCFTSDTVIVTTKSIPTVNAGLDGTICAKDSVKIGGSPAASGTSSPYTYSWSPSSGLSAASIANPNASPASTTSYILTVTDAGGCQNADTVIVKVNPLPVLNAGTASPICIGDSITLGGTPTASVASSPYIYRWSPATGLSDTISANPRAAPKTNTTYALKVTDSKGCKNNASLAIMVNAVPKAIAGSTKRICKGVSYTIGGSQSASSGKSPYTYAWSPSSGLSSTTASNPSATPVSTTTYKLVVKDANGCQAKDSVLINVNPLPVISAGANDTICKADTIKHNGSSNVIKYYWSPGKYLFDSTNLKTKAYPPTTTTYTLTGIDSIGCTTVATKKIVVNPLPIITAGGAKTICNRDSIKLGGSPTATSGTGAYIYLWSPATKLSGTNIANPYAKPVSTITYSLLVTDSKGCKAKDSAKITVNPIPLVSAGPDYTVCNKDSAPLGGSPTASGSSTPYGYSWSPSTGLNKSNIANPKTGPSSTTTYIVTVTDFKGCKNNDTVVVNVNALPKVNAGADVSICLKDSVTLGGSPTASVTTGPYTYSWLPTTGLNKSNIANPKASPAVTTTYYLTVTDGKGCKNYDTVVVTVNPLPKISAGLQRRICVGITTTLGGSPTAQNAKTPYAYTWSPSTGLSSTTVSNPTATPSSTTTYKLLVKDANGCQAKDSILINVNPLPIVSAGTNDTICRADTIKLNGSSNVSKYYWSPGKYLADSTNLKTKAYPIATTTYTLTGIDSIGCTSVSYKKIVVNPLPVITAGGAKTICNRDSIKLGGSPTATSGTGAYTYLWSPSTRLSGTNLANPYSKPVSTITYSLLVTDSKGCKAKDSAKITVNQLPLVSAGPDITICFKDSTLIGGSPTASGTTAPYAFAWSPATGLNKTNIANPKGSPASATTYIVTVTDFKGCKNTDTVLIKVNTLPTVNAGTDKTICLKDSVTLGGAPTATGTIGPYAYSWSPTLGLDQSNTPNPKASPSTTTKYILTVTDGKGCKNYDTVIVTVNPLPKLSAGAQRRICIGATTTLGGSPTAQNAKTPYSYTWSPSTSLSSTSVSNPTANPSSTITYHLFVKDANGCTNKDSVLVYVNPLPVVNAGTDDTICKGDSIKLKGTSSFAYKFSWSPGKYLNDSTLLTPKASPPLTTSFIVRAMDSIGCKGYNTVVINVRPKTALNPPDLRCANIIDKNTITLSWDPVSANTQFFYYTIYRQAGAGAFTKVAKFYPYTTNSWTDIAATRTDSISYSYFITVTNHCIVEGKGSDTLHSIILSTKKIGDKILNLTWNKLSSSKLIYTVLFDTGSGFKTYGTTGSLFYQLKSCNLNATYKIQVKDTGCNSFSYPSPGIILADKTGPSIDSIIEATTDNWGQISLIFKPSDSTDTKNYLIYKGDSSGAYSLVTTITHIKGKTNYTWQDKSVNANHTQYFYKIKATDTCGNISGFTTVHSPVLLKGKAGDLKSYLTWRNYIGFPTDTVEVQKYVSGKWKILAVLNNTYTSFTDSIGLGCNINYFYRITSRSITDKVFSYSDSVKVTPYDSVPPAKVNILNATVVSNNSIQVNFNKVPEVDVNRYEIYVSKNHGAYAKITTIFRPVSSPVSYLDTGINARIDTFSYMVKALDSCASNISKISEVHQAISLKGSPADYANHLAWSGYKGYFVKNYVVQLYKAGSWVDLSGGLPSNDTVYRDTLIPCKITRFYRIKAIENGGDNAISYSDSIGLTPFDTIRPAMPSLTVISVPTNGKIQLNWVKSASPDVRNYKVYRFSAGVYKLLASLGDVNTFIDSTGSTLVSNCYKVQAMDSCANNLSDMSPAHCSMALVVTNNGCERANYLSWNNYSGWAAISKYEIYRSVNGGAESLLKTLAAGTSYKDSGLSFHNSYCYRIKAYQSSGALVTWSNQFCKNVFFVDTPYVVVATKLNTSVSAGNIKISWTSQAGKPHLAYYKLYYSKTGVKPYTLLKDSIPLTVDSFIHKNLNTKVGEYYYYLQTIDSCQTLSEISAIHKTMDFTFHVGQLVHQLNWTPYKGWPVKYYIVQHAINNNPLVDEDTLKGTDTSLHKFPAPCNTRVIYRVKAVSYSGVVSYSDSMGGQAIDSIPSNAPTLENVSVLSGKLVRIDFLGSDSLDTYGYSIQRSKNGGSFATAGFINFTKPHAAHVFIDTVNTLNDRLCYEIITLDSCLNATTSQVMCAIQLTGNPGNLSNFLNWYPYEGYPIGKYEVMIYKNNSWQNLISTNTDTFYKHDSLSCNVPRTYKIEGYGTGGFNTFSDSITLIPFDTTRPAAPVLNYVSVLSGSSISVNWQLSTSKKVKLYEVQYKSPNGAWTVFTTVSLKTSTIVTGLKTHDSAYSFRIIAIDTCASNRSFYSNVHQSVLLSGLAQNLANKLSWSAYGGFGVNRYVILKLVNNTWKRLDSVNGATLTYTESGLSCNVPYYYKLLAYSNSGGFSSYSDSISVTPFDTTRPIAPVLNYVSVVSGSSISVNWQLSVSKKVKLYEVQYKSPNGAWSVFTTVSLKTSTIVTGLKTHDSAYSFRIIAIDTCANNRSFYSNVHQSVLLNGQAQNLANKLSWSAYGGFGGNRYVILKLVNNTWKRLDSVSGSTLTYTESGLSCNVPYFYKLLVYSNAGGFSSYADSISVTPFDTTRPIAPVLNYVSVVSGNSISVNWQLSVSKKVKLYEVQYKSPNGAWTVFTTVSLKTSTIVTGLKTHDSAYSFRIISIDTCANNRSFYSNVHQSVLLSGLAQNLANKLNWSAYGGFGVNRYVILKLVNNTWKRLDSVSGATLTYTENGLSCNVPYYYKLLVYSNAGGFSSYADSISVTPFDTTRPIAPVLNYVSVLSGNSISVNWQLSVSKKVKLYEVQYKSPNGEWTVFTTVSLKTSTIVTGLKTHDSAYSFRIIAIDTCANNRSFYSNVHQSVLLSGLAQNLANKLSWSAYGGFGVNRYVILKLVNNTWKRLDSVSGATLTYTESGLSCNVPYYYKLLAYSNAGGFSSYADSISVTPFDTTRPIAPIVNYATVLSPSTIFLNWQLSASKKVKLYEIQYKTLNGAYSVYATVNLKTSLTITGLNTHDSTYDFRIVAIDTCAGNRSFFSKVHQSILLGGKGQNLSNLLTWSSYQGFTVNRYIIYKNINNIWTKIDSVSGIKTSYLDTGLSCNVPRSYKILAISSVSPNYSYSDSISLTPFDTIKPPAPVIKYATVVDGSKIQLFWNKSVPRVKLYELWIKSANGNWNNTANLLNQYTYTFTGLNTTDSIYSFRIDVKDTCAANESPYSQVHTNINIKGTPGDLRNYLSWTPYKGFAKISKYYIYTLKGTWQRVDSVSGDSLKYTHLNLPCNVPVNYRVAALDNSGSYLAFSDSIQVTPFDTIKPPAPLFYSASVLPNSTVKVTWHWNRTSDVKYFEVWRSVNNSLATKIGTVTYDSSFVDNNITSKTDKNAYFVIAIDSCSSLNRSRPSRIDTLIRPAIKTGGCRAYIKLTWTPYYTLTGGTDAYEIYKSKNNGAFSYLAKVSGSVLTFTDFLVDSVNHFSYQIRAINYTSKISSYSDSIGRQPWQYHIPASSDLVYTTTRKTSAGNGAVYIKWNAYPFATDTVAKGYRLYFSYSKKGPYKVILDTRNPAITDYLLTGINTTDSNSYFYLKVYNTCNLEGDSNIIHSPIKLHIKNKDLEEDVSWKAYEGFKAIKNYEVYRSKDGSYYGLIATLPGTQTFFNDTNISCKHQYYYRIGAIPVDNTLAETFSDSGSVISFDTTFIAAPKIYLVSTNLTDKSAGAVAMEFRGNRKKNRKGFNIYASTDGVNFVFMDSLIQAKTDSIVWIQNGLNTIKNPYSFYITAFDSCGNVSTHSDTQTVVHLSVIAKSHADVLTWNAYKGWKQWNYTVERRTAGTVWIPIASIGSTSQTFTDSFVKCDTFYIYRIVSNNLLQANLISLSEEAGVTAFDTDAPVPPVIQFVTVSGTGVKNGKIDIQWKRSTSNDVAYYNIYRKNPISGIWEAIATRLTGTTYTDSNLNTAHAIYPYMIEALDSCRNPNKGNSIIHSSILLHAVSADQSIKLKWNAYTGWKPLYYDIIRDGARINRISGILTAYTDTPAMCPTVYHYTVKAIDAADTLNIAASNVDSAKPYDNIPPKSPYLIRATVSQPNNQVNLQWTKVTDFDVKGYKVMRRIAPMNYFATIQVINDPNDTNYTDILSNISDSLCYKIEAFDHCNNASVGSNLGCVIIVQGEAKSLSNILHWNDYKTWINGVDHYNLYRKTDDTLGYELLQTFKNPVFMYNDTGFTADGRHYCYRVEAVQNGGFQASSWSTELCLVQAPVVWIPNAFSPQISLGINDHFGPKGLFMAKYSMDIYNRWGQRIFFTDKSQPWDGSFMGTQVGEGVYLYHITVYGHDSRPYYFEGTVEIIR